MRILWWSNAPWATTGYGVQTRLFVPRLIQAGHEIAICAFYGLKGGAIEWNGIQVLPAAEDPIGLDVIGYHSEAWAADLTLSLFDAWAVRDYDGRGMRWVPWFPVDMEPLPRAVQRSVERAFSSIVFSQFGGAMCRAAGLDPMYVPHAVDLDVYQPMPQADARRLLGCPQDRFVVGMVAANRDHPSRKALPQVLEAFARFADRRKDAVLYLHTLRGDEPWAPKGIVHISALVRHLGIQDRVILAAEYPLMMGLEEEYLAAAYSAMDCLAAPSLGEGFGVPILEAQACGCPVLVGDWTSMGELCFAGHKIPREESEPFWTPMDSYFRVPQVGAIERGLELLYQRRGDSGSREQARVGAQAYGADAVTDMFWRPVLAALERKIRDGAPANRKAQLLLEVLAETPRGPVAEVGSVRCETEVPSDGFSTVYLARECTRSGRPFRSIERDPLMVDLANRVLACRGLRESVECGDGVAALARSEPLSLLYLDSSDDPQDTWRQFVAAPLLPGARVVVDDVQPHAGNPFGKGTRLVTSLTDAGVRFRIEPTEPGYAALVVALPGGKRAGEAPDAGAAP